MSKKYHLVRISDFATVSHPNSNAVCRDKYPLPPRSPDYLPALQTDDGSDRIQMLLSGRSVAIYRGDSTDRDILGLNKFAAVGEVTQEIAQIIDGATNMVNDVLSIAQKGLLMLEDLLSLCIYILLSGRRDSNARHQPWQGCALPLSYTRNRCF